MLTARDAEIDRVLGLELGADDYVTKPFSTAELLSRVRAILRRRELDRANGGATLRNLGGLQIDLSRHEVRVDGDRVHLTLSEFKVLALLAEQPDAVVSRKELMQHLWASSMSATSMRARCTSRTCGARSSVTRRSRSAS